MDTRRLSGCPAGQSSLQQQAVAGSRPVLGGAAAPHRRAQRASRAVSNASIDAHGCVLAFSGVSGGRGGGHLTQGMRFMCLWACVCAASEARGWAASSALLFAWTLLMAPKQAHRMATCLYYAPSPAARAHWRAADLQNGRKPTPNAHNTRARRRRSSSRRPASSACSRPPAASR